MVISMYQIGQCIMYRNIGICKIEAIGKLGFTSDKEKEYYTLQPLNTTNHTKIYVPIDTDTFMRDVMTEEEAYEYLDKLQTMQTEPFFPKKTVQLTEHYRSLLEGYDMIQHLKLFKEICQKEQRTKKDGKKFGQLDANYKNQIERLLIDEFSYALNETPDLSRKRLYESVLD